MSTKATILIVDDEQSARDVLRGFLATEPYNLLFASHAAEMFSVLEAVAPDVILLDVMLPDVDGFDVCSQVKADPRWKHIPIILVTALEGEKNFEKGYEAGADDFLHKPINDYELRVRVRSMLRIKRQYDQLQNSLRMREDLSNMMVHDMRTPLTSIIGYSTLLKMRQQLSTEDKRNVDLIAHQARRLDSFLNDMLMVAKQEQTGEMMVDLHPISTRVLAKAIESTHYFTAESRRITLDIIQKSPEAEILADGNLLQRVIDNLLSNALKFSPAGGVVTVTLDTFTPPSADRPHLRLTVADNGPGIPPDAKARIFDKFEVIAMRQRRVPQIGLGLVFCRLAVEAHNGRIWVENNHPTGSIFTVEL